MERWKKVRQSRKQMRQTEKNMKKNLTPRKAEKEIK